MAPPHLPSFAPEPERASPSPHTSAPHPFVDLLPPQSHHHTRVLPIPPNTIRSAPLPHSPPQIKTRVASSADFDPVSHNPPQSSQSSSDAQSVLLSRSERSLVGRITCPPSVGQGNVTSPPTFHISASTSAIVSSTPFTTDAPLPSPAAIFTEPNFGEYSTPRSVPVAPIIASADTIPRDGGPSIIASDSTESATPRAIIASSYERSPSVSAHPATRDYNAPPMTIGNSSDLLAGNSTMNEIAHTKVMIPARSRSKTFSASRPHTIHGRNDVHSQASLEGTREN